MKNRPDILLSAVVPIYNESAALPAFHSSLVTILHGCAKDAYEIVYCDDGSTDDTTTQLQKLCADNPRVKLIKLSRNFGKEIATTAGIHEARGEAIITLDADGQHPVELIPKFVARWKAGSKVVIGIRTTNQHQGFFKHQGSKLFYWLINRLTPMKLAPNSTDYRLIDRTVQQEFARMTERNRITRGLIDWLGYKRDYIEFEANPRLAGEATYTFRKLLKLAVDSLISLSISPLYITAYIGAFVLPLSVILGVFVLTDVIVGDPLHLHVTGSAYIIILLLFLVGVLLLSQAIIGLYLSHIHTETQNRPLYIIDKEHSIGL